MKTKNETTMMIIKDAETTIDTIYKLFGENLESGAEKKHRLENLASLLFLATHSDPEALKLTFKQLLPEETPETRETMIFICNTLEKFNTLCLDSSTNHELSVALQTLLMRKGNDIAEESNDMLDTIAPKPRY